MFKSEGCLLLNKIQQPLMLKKFKIQLLRPPWLNYVILKKLAFKNEFSQACSKWKNFIYKIKFNNHNYIFLRFYFRKNYIQNTSRIKFIFFF
jgi:hypothetical protein